MNIKQLLKARGFITPDAPNHQFTNNNSSKTRGSTLVSCHDQQITLITEEIDEIPPALAAIANGRDHIDTPELGRVTLHAKQTIRKLHSQQGHYFGITPIKIGNKLLWPVRPVAQLLRKGHKC